MAPNPMNSQGMWVDGSVGCVVAWTDGWVGGRAHVRGSLVSHRPCSCHSDIHGPKPYKFIGFGDIHGPKPYKFIGFGDIHGPKPWTDLLTWIQGQILCFSFLGGIPPPRPPPYPPPSLGGFRPPGMPLSSRGLRALPFPGGRPGGTSISYCAC